MKSFIRKVVLVLCAMFLTACLSVYIAIVIVDYGTGKAKAENYNTIKEYTQNMQNAENEIQKYTDSDIQRDDEAFARKESTDNDENITVPQSDKVKIEKKTIEDEGITFSSDEINRVISNIPFKKKVAIIKKALPKLTAKDVSFFLGLVKNGVSDDDVEKAGERLYSVFSEDELEEFYKIYLKYYKGEEYES